MSDKEDEEKGKERKSHVGLSSHCYLPCLGESCNKSGIVTRFDDFI